jgi:pre-mRNA-splicing factor CDC5/CEF1
MLPEPQISDRELEEIAKMGYASDLISGEDGLVEGSGVTRSLLSNYNQTPARPGMTPLRTPQRTPGGKGDAIMMEAEVKASGAVLMIFLALIIVSHSGKVYSLDSS